MGLANEGTGKLFRSEKAVESLGAFLLLLTLHSSCIVACELERDTGTKLRGCGSSPGELREGVSSEGQTAGTEWRGHGGAYGESRESRWGFLSG